MSRSRKSATVAKEQSRNLFAEHAFDDDDGPVSRTAVLAPAPPAQQAAPLAQSLPPDLKLEPLLQFVPDVAMKERLLSLAEDVASIDVTKDDGLQRADKGVADLKAGIAEIAKCFEYPCSLANRLHKRLTGLRTDFTKRAEEVADATARAIKVEVRRRERVAEEARIAAQAAADEEVRRTMSFAAEGAKAQGAPKQIVEALLRSAETATAPPVRSPVPVPKLENSTLARKIIARFKGTPDDCAEPHPKMADLTPEQQEKVLEMMRGCINRTLPMVAFEINWKELDAMASSQRATLDVFGIEAYDEGSLRKKGGA